MSHVRIDNKRGYLNSPSSTQTSRLSVSTRTYVRKMCGGFPVQGSIEMCISNIHWTYNSEDHREFLNCNSKTKGHQHMLHRSRCLIVWRHHQQHCMPPAPIKTHPVPSPSLFYMGFLPPVSSWPSLTHTQLMISLIPKLNFSGPPWSSPCWWGI